MTWERGQDMAILALKRNCSVLALAILLLLSSYLQKVKTYLFLLWDIFFHLGSLWGYFFLIRYCGLHWNVSRLCLGLFYRSDY